MTTDEFVILAALSQMQGHPILGTTYVQTTCNHLLANAIMLANTLTAAGYLKDEE